MAGQIISAKDGRLSLADDDSTATQPEVPCMTDWNLGVSAQFNTDNNVCMASNDDGGSSQSANWDSNELTGKGWNVSAQLYWQEVDEGASPAIDPVNIGTRKYARLYPNEKDAAKVLYKGWVYIENVEVPSNVSGKIRQNITLRGDGALAKEAIA